MINLDKNENQYGPSEKCKKVIQNITLEMFNSYSRSYPKLIINKLEKEFKINGEHILLGYGSEDILKQIFYFVSKDKKRKKVLLASQAWWYYSAIAREVNAEIFYYDMVEKKKSFEYDITRILEILDKETIDILIICSPNNPTGNSLKKNDLKKILKKSKKKKTVVVFDEAYWGFAYTSNYALKLVEDYDNLIVLRTFSKFYALAGLRIGFGFAGKSLKSLIQFNMRYLGYNRISEELSFAALDSKDYYLKVAKLMENDKKKYYKELEKLGLKVYRSDANFILVKVPNEWLDILKVELEKAGVIVRFFNDGVLKNTIRISIGTQEQNEVVIKLFQEILGEKYN